MRDIVLLSFTPKDWTGGVNRWVRDFMSGFPNARHYSWLDVTSSLQVVQPDEWVAADTLGVWLHNTRRIKKDDIIISDGFWGDKLGQLGYDVISVAHGIWSHLTKEDADAGKRPEFPVHNQYQIKHRREHLARGGKIVAVSEFIQEQMKLQWGFESTVINNAIDTKKFTPPKFAVRLDKPLIIHGVTTHNKGLDHVSELRGTLVDTADVLLLDDAAKKFGVDKYEALGQAQLVVQPSAYEGNSYFVLETLACDVPIVAYNVGLLHTIKRERKHCVGCVMDRKFRSPQQTAKVTKFLLESVLRERSLYNPREAALEYDVFRFCSEWRKLIDEY